METMTRIVKRDATQADLAAARSTYIGQSIPVAEQPDRRYQCVDVRLLPPGRLILDLATDEPEPPRKRTGFALLSEERRREIARQGGKVSPGGFRSMSLPERLDATSRGGRAAHINGITQEWDSDEARRAGMIGHPPRRATTYRNRRGRVFQVTNEEVHDA